MVILLVALFIVPFGMAVTTLIDSAVQGVELVRGVAEQGLRPLPDWLVTIPWAGPRIDARWRELAALPPEGLADMLRPFLLSAAGWAVTLTGGIGRVAIHFLLTVLLAAILYTNGEAAAAGVVAFARRIGADRAERTVRLAAQATRGVALGVVVTAVVQTAIAGAGLWLVGAPRAGLLTAVLFVLCIAQLGPLLVMIPVIAWLFWTGSIGWGIVLVVVAVIVAIVDNVLKPVLIRRGVDLPLLLIVAGVIGGLIGFGVMGLFIGPVVLAVTYTLLGDWIREGEPAQS
jgi:predicted PurR-regulated permease PerM